MIRTKTAAIPYLVLAAAVLSGWLWNMGDQVAGFSGSGVASVGGPFALTDQNGVARTDADFRGRYMLIYFGYSFCPDVCPTTLGVMADAVERLGAKAARVAPVFITVDPERDKPDVLKQYLAVFSPRFTGLTGNLKDVVAVSRAYRVYFIKHPLPGGGYYIDHSSSIYMMGPDGKFVTSYDVTIGPDGLAADLKKRLQ